MAAPDYETTCGLCGVKVRICRVTGQHSGKVREHLVSVRPHPKDPNNHYACYCTPGDGTTHKEAVFR